MLAFLDPPEIILLVVVILVIFGGSQLPKLARNLGKAQQEFKSGLSEGQKEAEREKSLGKPAGSTDVDKLSE